MTDSDQGREGASTFAAVVKRRGLLVVATALVAAAAAGALSSRQDTRYESTALLLFRPLGPEYQILGLGLTPAAEDLNAQSAADVVLVSSRQVAARAARRGGQKRSVDEVTDGIRVDRQEDSRIVTVTASGGHAAAAARLANDYARASQVVQREAEARRARAARRVLLEQLDRLSSARRRGEEGKELRRQIRQLTTLERIGSGSPQLAEPARPAAEPVVPRTERNVLLGGLFGLLLGGALAAMREQSDRRLRHRGQLEQAFELPILAEIPRSRALARRRAFADLPPDVAEAFQLLQVTVRYRRPDEGPHRIMVTSAASGEGRSTVAWNLASAASVAGVAVMVIEADLRRPDFAVRGRLRAGPGLSEALSGDVAVEEATQTVSLHSGANGAGSAPRMSVVVGGRAPATVSGLLQSPRLPELLSVAGRKHDLVIVDAPPFPVAADAVPLTRLVDGVLVVAHVGRSTDEQAALMRDRLASLQAPVLGVVANAVR
jgi:tyrosine-protein kinase